MDEAHDLVDRAREMFSADIEGQKLLDVKRAINRAAPRCARALMQLHTVLRKLGHATEPDEETIETSDPSVELNLFPVKAAAIRKQQDDGAITSREFPKSMI